MNRHEQIISITREVVKILDRTEPYNFFAEHYKFYCSYSVALGACFIAATVAGFMFAGGVLFMSCMLSIMMAILGKITINHNKDSLETIYVGDVLGCYKAFELTNRIDYKEFLKRARKLLKMWKGDCSLYYQEEKTLEYILKTIS